ncbi:MAG: substrate-binding periplasmic protein [Desulforhopalus sp.]
MKRVYSLLLFIFLLPSHPLLAAELTILTENLPPLNYLKDGKLVGPSVEIINEIQKRVGSSAKIRVLPWARAYRLALEEENVVLFGTTQTRSRQELFKWVGPLATKRDILVALKGSELNISSLEDAKKVNRIGTLRDDTRERFLKEHGFTNIEPVSNDQKNAKKLILGRLDLWAYKEPGLKTVCELAGVNYNALEEVLHLRRIDVSIAFSKKTSDAIVLKWQKAFDEMTQDGTIKRIRNNWNLE